MASREETWSRRVAALRGWNPVLHQAVIVGFNRNRDLVRRIRAEEVASVLRALPPELAQGLEGDLTRSPSAERHVGPSLEPTLRSLGPFEAAAGGQAGIVVEVVSALGGRAIELTGEPRDLPHYVFEFRGAGGHSGRLILSTSQGLVPPPSDATAAAIAAGADSAFLSGFHLMEPETIRACARHLLRLRSAGVPVHLELAASGPAVVDALRGLFPLADSLGGNAGEVRHLLGLSAGTPRDLLDPLRQFVKENLMARVHVHLDGMQLAVTEGASSEEPRALLLASAAAAEVAGTGQVAPTLHALAAPAAEDLARYEVAMEDAGGDPETGRIGGDAVLVPSPRVPSPRRVVGLGDVLSSVAFLARARHLQARPEDEPPPGEEDADDR